MKNISGKICVLLPLLFLIFFVSPSLSVACTVSTAGSSITPQVKAVGDTDWTAGLVTSSSSLDPSKLVDYYAGQQITGKITIKAGEDCFAPITFGGPHYGNINSFWFYRDQNSTAIVLGSYPNPLILGTPHNALGNTPNGANIQNPNAAAESIPWLATATPVNLGASQTFSFTMHSSALMREISYGDANGTVGPAPWPIDEGVSASVYDACNSGASINLTSRIYDQKMDIAAYNALHPTHLPGLRVDNYQLSGEETDSSQWRFSEIADIQGDIKVELLPAFVSQMQKERNFTPAEPINPLDKVAVRVMARQCPGQELLFNADLMTVDVAGKEQVIANSSGTWTLLYAGQYLTREEAIQKMGQTAYSAYIKSPVREFYTTINGWSSAMGQTSQAKELLVDSIAKGRNIFVRVSEFKDPTHKKDQSLVMSNCAQVYGAGPQGIVVARGESVATNPAGLFGKEEDYRTFFVATQPFKQYVSAFSFYVDLKKMADKDLLTSIVDHFTQGSYISANSSCKSGAVYSLIVPDDPTRTWYGISDMMGHFLITLGTKSSTFTHEFGHTFAKLWDEEGGPTEVEGNLLVNTNCSLAPDKDFMYNNILFGDKILGCTHVNSFKPSRTMYRSSLNSIMNYGALQTDKFNAVSCSFVVSAISGGNSKSHLQECAQLISNP